MIGGSSEPAGRGLALLIVDEREPAKVDRDIALIVDDWRLGEDGAPAPFGVLAEASTSGRLGNRLTINAKARPRRSRPRRDRAFGCGWRTPATPARCASASTT